MVYPTTPISLDEKIGQMLMIGFRGLDIDDNNPIVRDIKEYYLGGVALFDYDRFLPSHVRNIKSPQQLKKLTEYLQSISSIPLFISIDHEGGKVNRLKEKYGFPPAPSHQFLGKKNDPEFTFTQGDGMAKILHQMGINLNFAPVVDVNTNPLNPIIGKIERSFSADPKTVTAHAMEFIRGHHQNRVLIALKHFPGHGSSKTDSHIGFTDITDTWQDLELEPYRKIIETKEADMIMTAHVFNANLDTNYPATLSHNILTNLLRKDLGYDGVIITDCMQMGAITKNFGYKTAVLQAINAGVDILLISNTLEFDEDIVPKTIQLIKKCIFDGKINTEQVDRSFERIMTLKHKIKKGKK